MVLSLFGKYGGHSSTLTPLLIRFFNSFCGDVFFGFKRISGEFFIASAPASPQRRTSTVAPFFLVWVASTIDINWVTGSSVVTMTKRFVEFSESFANAGAARKHVRKKVTINLTISVM